MRVLVDVDGVVAECAGLMLREINERFRTVWTNTAEPFRQNWVQYKDIKYFDCFTNPERGIFTKGECKFAVENFARSSFAYDMPVLNGSVQSISKLREAGHDVVFVTAQWGESIDWTHSRVRWLEQHFDAKLRDIIFAHRKELVLGDVLIDDRVETCIKYAQMHPSAQVYMYKQPWNVNAVELPDNVMRFTWDHVGMLTKRKEDLVWVS